MKEKKYNWSFDWDCIPAIVFGVGIINGQPKKRYKNADWHLTVLIPFFVFNINLTYKY